MRNRFNLILQETAAEHVYFCVKEDMDDDMYCYKGSVKKLNSHVCSTKNMAALEKISKELCGDYLK
jgi:hypothetical protein